MAITLLLADDHQLVRQSLISLLEHEGFDVLGEASDGRTAVRLVQELSPEIAVLDMVMPGLNGIDAARQIQRASPRTKSILVTMYAERQYVVQALRAGIRGYVLKSQGARDLIQAIREVHNGAVYLSPKVSELAVDLSLGRAEAEADPLSPREREVVQLDRRGSHHQGGGLGARHLGEDGRSAPHQQHEEARRPRDRQLGAVRGASRIGATLKQGDHPSYARGPVPHSGRGNG